MSNALQRDLERLVARVEREDGPQAAADPFRQTFHLMPPVGWLNDPNGLCRCGDWYHVFYQYGPFDVTGGVKHWGHYRSRDLLHWEALPVMLYPDQPWDIHGVYSGSALVEDGTLYLYYTGNVKHAGNYDYIKAGRGHNTALAVSKDGVTVESNTLLMENKDYPDGLTCHVRDPKVWAQDGKYYMVQGARTLDDHGQLLVFESTDKFNWTFLQALKTPHHFGYMWECPDLFCVDGQWFLVCSPQGVPHEETRFQNVYSCGYFPLHGDFRGEYSLGEFVEMDLGFDFYAPQTFQDGDRRLMFGWMGMPDADYTNPTTESGWQHCLTVPCELRRQGDRLVRLPAVEVTALRGAAIPAHQAQVFDLEAMTEPTGRMVFRDAAVLEWQPGLVTLSFLEGGAGRTLRRVAVDQLNALRILGDSSSLEIFLNDGQQVLSTRYYPQPEAQGIAITGAQARVWEMGAMQVTQAEG